jgi:Holliday junction DNA helicase RuvA
MIGRLTGKIESIGEDQAIIDVNGVGYIAHCSARTLQNLKSGQIATLHIETRVREDAITLIGFADEREKDAFQLLTTIQGVGARVALALLSALTPAQLADAILSGDKTLLCSADGVGPKLALRLLTELKEKAAGLGGGLKTAAGKGKPAPDGVAGDAVSTLTHLGFRRDEAYSAVLNALNDNRTIGFDDLVRTALQGLSTRR